MCYHRCVPQQFPLPVTTIIKWIKQTHAQTDRHTHKCATHILTGGPGGPYTKQHDDNMIKWSAQLTGGPGGPAGPASPSSPILP